MRRTGMVGAALEARRERRRVLPHADVVFLEAVRRQLLGVMSTLPYGSDSFESLRDVTDGLSVFLCGLTPVPKHYQSQTSPASVEAGDQEE